MPVITGGRVIEPQTTNPGLKQRVYKASAAVTNDAGFTAATGLPAQPTGTLIEDVVTGNVYERTAANVYTRIDTI